MVVFALLGVVCLRLSALANPDPEHVQIRGDGVAVCRLSFVGFPWCATRLPLVEGEQIRQGWLHGCGSVCGECGSTTSEQWLRIVSGGKERTQKLVKEGAPSLQHGKSR